jgi:hypothetical protein
MIYLKAGGIYLLAMLVITAYFLSERVRLRAPLLAVLYWQFWRTQRSGRFSPWLYI